MPLKPFYIKKYNVGMTGEEVKEALKGGGSDLPDITSADYGKVLVVDNTGKLKFMSINYTIQLESTDGVTWASNMSFQDIADIIVQTPLPVRFNFELILKEVGDGFIIGTVANVPGVYIAHGPSQQGIYFTADINKQIIISSDDIVTVFFT